MSDSSTSTNGEATSWKLSAVIIVVILLVAGGIAAFIFSTEPTAEKSGATKRTAMLVDVVDVQRGDYSPRIVAQGTVEPAQDVELRPQVGGRVTALADGFVPGGFVEEGELLVRIEAADYENTLEQRKSELRQALSDLAVEEGRQEAAQAEYDYIDEELAPENEDLVLRRPQLQAIQGQVRAARAAVEQAELNLQRTTVEAPFDAHIIRRDVNVGSQISATDPIARLVGIEEYWVGVELPLSKLRWVSAADEAEKASAVKVRNDQSWPPGAYRSGHLFKVIGTLDENTRMARVLASVPDPLLRRTDPKGEPDMPTRPALMIGEFVEVEIQGNEIADVVRLSRDYVRENDTTWVMVDGKLQVRNLDIVARDAVHAYVSSGLEDGEQVVTTNISTVVEGAPLRLEASSEEADGE